MKGVLLIFFFVSSLFVFCVSCRDFCLRLLFSRVRLKMPQQSYTSGLDSTVHRLPRAIPPEIIDTNPSRGLLVEVSHGEGVQICCSLKRKTEEIVFPPVRKFSLFCLLCVSFIIYSPRDDEEWLNGGIFFLI